MKKSPLRRAHEFFRHAEPYIGLLVAAGFFTWLAKGGQVLGVDTWAEAAFLGVGVAVVLMFALAAVLIGWRYFSPLSPSEESSGLPELDSDDRPDFGHLAVLEAKIDDIDEKVRTIIHDYQAMLAKAENLRSDLAATNAKLDEIIKDREVRRERIASSFLAIWNREALAKLSDQIRADADELSRRITDGEAHDTNSWDRWESVHAHWWSSISRWWQIARFYLANSRQVLLAPDDRFRDTEVDESLLIPAGGAEAVRVYKKYRIIQDQWEAVQEQLAHNVIQVAFIGMSELDVRHGRPLEQS